MSGYYGELSDDNAVSDALAIRTLVDLQTNLEAKIKVYREREKFEIVDILSDLEALIQARLESMQRDPDNFRLAPKIIPASPKRKRRRTR